MLDSCCASFAQALKVEMESLARQEKSLRKFAKSDAAGPTGDPSSLQDMDKIQIQLYIDVDTFLKESRPLRSGAGGDHQETAGETKLREVTCFQI